MKSLALNIFGAVLTVALFLEGYPVAGFVCGMVFAVVAIRMRTLEERQWEDRRVIGVVGKKVARPRSR